LKNDSFYWKTIPFIGKRFLLLKMITVGTPGLGVRQPHGSTLADFPSGGFSIRVADAQTGRPYSNHYQESFPRIIIRNHYHESFSIQ
jgi:hypothetical protein